MASPVARGAGVLSQAPSLAAAAEECIPWPQEAPPWAQGALPQARFAVSLTDHASVFSQRTADNVSQAEKRARGVSGVDLQAQYCT